MVKLVLFGFADVGELNGLGVRNGWFVYFWEINDYANWFS